MIKYYNYQIVFAEIPDEVTLAINITNCPCHCQGCHSSHLAEDIGEELSEDVLYKLITENDGITCVSFMGGDIDPKRINTLASYVKEFFPNLKTAWYSGRKEKSEYVSEQIVDYIKIGPYIDEYGPLNKETTNQRMYYHGKDITEKFWKKEVIC